ncbi:hypothetical protein ILUMI_04678 [Ignelater luminosus]|uniref:Uncharacterized protein n=1 Tax=Ignelater luminosus TaxID=2038154 RepID=A0A8K0D973_IGNLU|nr:hypothetical protein ILUMI_04678 [Ignelater luminosus]
MRQCTNEKKGSSRYLQLNLECKERVSFAELSPGSSGSEYVPDTEEISQVENDPAEDNFNQDQTEKVEEINRNENSHTVPEAKKADNAVEVSARKRMKMRYVDSNKWKRKTNQKNRESRQTYKGKTLKNIKWTYNNPRNARIEKDRCKCEIEENKK